MASISLRPLFVIRTDHQSLKQLLQQVIQTPEQQTYLRKLLSYHFRIEYKPGHTNGAANALSRMYEDSVIETVESDFATLYIAVAQCHKF